MKPTHFLRRIFLRHSIFPIIGFSILCFAPPAFAQQQTLEQTLTIAYVNNQGLKAERAKLRAADEQVSIALSGYRPTLDAVGEIGHTTGKVAGSGFYAGNSNLNPRSLGVNLTQNIFNGLKTYSSVDSAKSNVQAQRALLQDAEQKLILEATKAHLDVIQAHEAQDLNRENERVLRRQLEITQDRFRVGDRTKTDVSQAQSRLHAAIVSRLQAESDYANAKSTFARIVGEPPSILEKPGIEAFIDRKPKDVARVAVKNNPSVVAASFAHDAAESDIAVARAELMPKLDAIASGTRSWDQSTSIRDRQDSASIMGRLTIPLYRQGADYAKTRQAQQVSTQRRLELEYTRLKAKEEALTSYQSLETAMAAIVGRREVVSSAAEALQGVREESKVGTRTTLDVLNAEQELLEAKIALVKAQHDAALATFQLKAAMGDLTASALHLDAPIYDPEKNYTTVKDQWIGFSKVEEEINGDEKDEDD